jgi:hypothetical protein
MPRRVSSGSLKAKLSKLSLRRQRRRKRRFSNELMRYQPCRLCEKMKRLRYTGALGAKGSRLARKFTIYLR